MSTFAKIMVVVNFVLAIAFLAAAGTLHGAADSWRSKHDQARKDLQQQIDNLDAQYKGKVGELDEARRQSQALEGRASAAEAVQKQQAESNAALMREVENKTAEITQLIAANNSATTALNDAQKQIESLNGKLATSESERKQALDAQSTVQENLDRETQRADSAEQALAAAQAANQKLTDDLDSANTAIGAFEAHFGKLPEGITVKAVRGVVQAASAKDDVYVISVGSKDDVKVGYEFTVSRGSHYVSTIVIDSVWPNHATGHTKNGMRKMDVQAGDSVATGPGL